MYKKISDTTPSGTGTFIIVRDWTEAGVHWFQVAGTITGGSTIYELDRITGDGSLYESTASMSSFPAAIDPAAGFMTTRRIRM